MTQTLREPVVLEATTCITCGVQYAMPQELMAAHRRLGGYYHCPNGHQQGWEKGTDQIEREKAEAARRKAEADFSRECAAHDQTKAALKELQEKQAKNETRIRKGVCPCCNRTFSNIARHMATQHADSEEAKAAAVASEKKARPKVK